LVERARAAVGAPDTVSASLNGDVLRLHGTAPHNWILHARDMAPGLRITAIRKIETDEIRDSDLEALRAEIEAGRILFPIGSSEITPAQVTILDSLAAKSDLWAGDAIAIGKIPSMQVIGYTDRSGTDQRNLSLSEKRARKVAEVLVKDGVRPELLTVSGKGTSAEDVSNTLQRQVVLRLSLRAALDAREGSR
jgi:outer membrane protein OmpA-like peptidoglycan-associated protein